MADTKNRLSNGRFERDLSNWQTSGATYSVGDGDAQYGVAVLAAGGYIEQDFAIPRSRVYTLGLVAKGVSNPIASGDLLVTLTDQNSNQVTEVYPVTLKADNWEPFYYAFGLAAGQTYTIRFTNAGVNVIRLDDIWLWSLVRTRQELALLVYKKVAKLAAGASFLPNPTEDKPEGDFTEAVNSALISVGAINADTDEPDIRYLEAEQLQACLDAAERAALELLYHYYSYQVDVSAGPMRESLSQRASAILEAINNRAGNQAVVIKSLKRA